MANLETNNYTLGRGEVHFGRFKDDDETKPLGLRYIGNTPEFSLTISQEVLDHFSSDRGVREKDESIPLQVNRSGSLTTDNIDPANVALFFFGEDTDVTEVGGAVTGEAVGGDDGVTQGLYYQLGLSASRPMGARGLIGDTDDSNSAGAFLVYEADSNSAGGTPYVATTDYVLDADQGTIYIVPGGGIASGTFLQVNYTIKASTSQLTISGSAPVAGHMKFIAYNPTGDNIDYYLPYVKVSPNGDYALKSDEWQTIPFSIEVLKRTDREAIYAGTRPAFT